MFAIAITLLVLEIRIPEGTIHRNAELLEALRELTPRLVAYGMTFAVVGLSWLVHWRRYAVIRSVDGRLANLNLCYLAFIAILPFPTALLGDYGDLPTAVVVYACTVSATVLLGAVSWLYAVHAGLVEDGVSAWRGRRGASYSVPVPVPFVMLGSLPLLAVVPPPIVELSWLLILPALRLVAGRFDTDPAATG